MALNKKAIAPWIFLLFGSLIALSGHGFYRVYKGFGHWKTGDVGIIYGEINQTKYEDLLLYLLDEEKLDRDFYLKFYERFNVTIFRSLSESEERRLNAVRNLLEKHNLSCNCTEFPENFIMKSSKLCTALI